MPNREEETIEYRARKILELTYDALLKSLSDPEHLPPLNQLTAVWNAFAGKEGGREEPAPTVEVRLPEEVGEYAE